MVEIASETVVKVCAELAGQAASAAAVDQLTLV